MKKLTKLWTLVLCLIIGSVSNVYAGSYSGPDLSGQKITISGPWLAPEDGYMREIAGIFEKATGATVEYGGSDSFEQQIVIDIKAGSPPDIAIFPQPGLAANMAAIGGLQPLSNEVKNAVLNNYAAGQSWVDLATYPDQHGYDQFYAIFYKVNVKSLVWYSPDNFSDNGYEVPGTMEELIALTKQMASDGNTPWCIG